MNLTTFLYSAREAAGVAKLEAALKEIVVKGFTSEASEGKTLISTSEAGGNVTFSVDGSLGRAEVLDLAVEGLIAVRTSPHLWLDENWHPRKIKRYRSSFVNAITS